MRLVTYDAGNGPRAGILLGEEIVDAEAAGAPASSVRDILEALGPEVLADIGSAAADAADRTQRSDVSILSAIPDPQ
ncbi:MAG: hypothetical protein ACKOTH_04060 [Solirubrobacterales bacterium]